ncbi:MAG TPA: acetate kinase [Candidatus Fimiplasma intestinipullorum]|uniref:Acetate kinase n=1 Tax=Candidatus Fimiplasma intestinipullorum TaxID=2840825 RepID=A0A9D1L113_9FIRM|nr:acetate kinase [Candidatus Fimiplasma intestinipullorum]
MAKIIAVNAGSSSLKFQLFEMNDESVIASGVVERIGFEDAIFTLKFNGEKFEKTLPIPDHKKGVELLLESLIEHHVVESLNEIQGVGHRIVQGGDLFSDSVIFDQNVANGIASIANLAPLHNQAHLTGYYAFKEAMPGVGHVAVFDTAFHSTMAPETYLYAVPYEYYEKNHVRRYGFHGSSHRYVSGRCIELMGNPEHSKIIVCHLGAGGSLCAVKDGKSINTSMGLTPLAGIMMGSRCGEIDPSVVTFIMSETGETASRMDTIMNKESGLLGVSGVSSDYRDVEAAANEGNERAQIALKIFARRVADFIGSYYVQLGGVDAICFTAGIGENSFTARANIINEIKDALGVEIDEEANRSREPDRLISTPNSKVKVYVIPTNEELVIARDTKRLLNL